MMPAYDIPSLERAIENVENNDAETHKLYNNLGLAYAAAGKYRLSLKAHREEKRACKRLAASNPADSSRLLDLAIAYRRCGDVMLRVDRLVDIDGLIIRSRRDVIEAAREQHLKGLSWATKLSGTSGAVEVQAASAAVAQSAIALALDGKDSALFQDAARCCYEAGKLAESLPEQGHVSAKAKQSMILGASLNMAIALSGLSEKENARTLLHAVAIRAKSVGDDGSYVRAISNLAEEASEEEDWDLCETYVREWVRLAQLADDQADESGALCKLAVVLREKRDLMPAKTAVKRALMINATRETRQEAKNFLEVIEQEMQEIKQHEDEMDELCKKAAQLEGEGKYIEEARARLDAGNCAFALKKLEHVARLLGRYFVLVDEYGCNTAVTGIEKPLHNSAVANLAEAMWKMNRLEDAVKWATRELTCFDDDMAGQAQAWCNLGVYLDDFGRKDNAVHALLKSIELAEKSGEIEVLKRAKSNLYLVRPETSSAPNGSHVMSSTGSRLTENLKGDTDVMRAAVGQDSVGANAICRSSASREEDIVPTNAQEDRGGEKSVMISSDQPPTGSFSESSEGVFSTARNRSIQVNDSASKRSCHSTGSQRKRAISCFSNGADTAERSSVGFRAMRDIVADFKAVCQEKNPAIRIRSSILDAFRALSSGLIAQQACDGEQAVTNRLRLSSLFLSNQDAVAIFETLSRAGGEQDIHLDMSMNPLLSAGAYECLFSSVHPTRLRLFCIKHLDLSCAGVSASSLRTIADAMLDGESLCLLKSLNVSKNVIGSHGRLAASVVSRLLVRTKNLEVLDISLNLLPKSFLTHCLEDVESLVRTLGNGADQSGMKVLNLCMNNRRYPSALFEGWSANEAVTWFSRLFDALAGIEYVDVRACGATADIRTALQEYVLGRGSPRRIITVSDGAD